MAVSKTGPAGIPVAPAAARPAAPAPAPAAAAPAAPAAPKDQLVAAKADNKVATAPAGNFVPTRQDPVAAAAAGKAQPEPIRYPDVDTSYTVKKGDTLSAIESRYSMPPGTIQWSVDGDQIKDRNKIFPNQELNLPGWAGYVVKKGDTLSKLAQQTGSTVDVLVKANQIKNPNLIHVGDVIQAPVNPEAYGC